jgi:hypothetical protein
MGPDHRPVWARPSFAFAYHHYFDGSLAGHEGKLPTMGQCGPHSDPLYSSPGAVGGAWAWTRKSFEAVGGLLDICIMGSADWYMAFGLIGRSTGDREELQNCDPAYVDVIKDWERRAFATVEGNIGCVDQFILHEWHGDMRKRGYDDRWQILRDNRFDPAVDLVTDAQGLLQWAGNKPRLRDAVRRYFLSRDEDSTRLTYTPLF